MHPTAEQVKQDIAAAYGVPEHLKAALISWIDSVEERLAGGDSGGEQASLRVEDDPAMGDEETAAGADDVNQQSASGASSGDPLGGAPAAEDAGH